MVEITRRGMLGGVAMGGLLWNTAALSSELRQPPYGPAPAPLDGPELPSFRYPLGGAEDRAIQRRHRQGSQCHRLPGLGKACRRLHDARAGRAARAALARQCRRMGLCDRGPLPRHHHRPRRPMRDRRFRPRRRLVFPARPRPFDPGARARHLHLPSGLRQRLFLGVRHLLDHRLARPYAARRAGQEFWRAGFDLRRLSQEGGLYRQRPGAAAAAGRSRARLAERAAAHPSLPLARRQAGSLRRRHAAPVSVTSSRSRRP